MVMIPKEDLDKKFRPIFEEFAEQGGIPVDVLRETLAKVGDSQLSLAVINSALLKADADKNKVLSYEEFVKMMQLDEMKGLDASELTRFRRFLRLAVGSVMPFRATKTGESNVDLYLREYTCFPPPLFIPVISVLEMAIFIYYVYDMKKRGFETYFRSGAPLYSPLTYNPMRRYEAWRFLSYMFIHNGFSHIASNLVFQLLIGLPLEMVHKFWRVGTVYCLGVIAGSIGSSMSDPRIFLVGASGGCYALVGAHVATILMNWKNMTHDWMKGGVRFALSAPTRLIFWIAFAASDIGVAVWSRHADNKISYSAHFTGAMAGILVGVPVLKNIEILPWEKAMLCICLFGYALLMAFGLLWNVYHTGFPPTDWRKCCPDVP